MFIRKGLSGVEQPFDLFRVTFDVCYRFSHSRESFRNKGAQITKFVEDFPLRRGDSARLKGDLKIAPVDPLRVVGFPLPEQPHYENES